MRKLIAFLFLLAALNCLAQSWVEIPTTNWDLSLATNSVVVTNISEPYADGSYLVTGYPRWTRTTNGLARVQLLGGNYALGIQNYKFPNPILFQVPANDTNTYNVLDLLRPGGNVFVLSGVQKIIGTNGVHVEGSGKGVVGLSSDPQTNYYGPFTNIELYFNPDGATWRDINGEPLLKINTGFESVHRAFDWQHADGSSSVLLRDDVTLFFDPVVASNGLSVVNGAFIGNGQSLTNLSASGNPQLVAATNGIANGQTNYGNFTVGGTYYGGSLRRLAFVQQPTDTLGGFGFSPQVTVRLEDGFGNALTDDGVSVNLGIVGTSVAIGGSISVSTVAGLATFDAAPDGASGSPVLVATAGGYDQAVSQPFNLTGTNGPLAHTWVNGNNSTLVLDQMVFDMNSSPFSWFSHFPGITNLTLYQELMDTVNVTGDDNLQSVACPNLTAAYTLAFSGNGLTNIDLPRLRQWGPGFGTISVNTGFAHLGLDGATAISGLVVPASVTNQTFNALLAYTNNSALFSGLANITNFAAPLLEYASGLNVANGLPILKAVDLRALANWDASLRIEPGDGLVSLNLDSLTAGDGLYVQNDNSLPYLALPALTTATSDLYINNCAGLTGVSLPVFAAGEDIEFISDTSLTNLALPALVNSTHPFNVSGGTVLTNVSAPLLVSFNGATAIINNNPALLNIGLGSWVPENGVAYDFTGNALVAAAVNALIHRAYLNIGSLSSGSMDLSGGTSAAPTGAGITEAAALNLAGFTVTTN